MWGNRVTTILAGAGFLDSISWKIFQQIQSHDADPQKIASLERQHGGLGNKFFLFMEFLASRQFHLLQFLDFSEPGMHYHSVLMHAQLEYIHKVCCLRLNLILF